MPGSASPEGKPSAGAVVLRGLTKRYGRVGAVAGVDLEVKPGTFFTLLGPSGCGKSTLLRMIAGLEEPTSGQISIDGVDVTRMSAQQRPTAMVFQSYALFPTMTVGQNVEYGLRVRKHPKAARADRVAEALGRVGLAGLEARPVTALSGGQQQRVALARALVVQPAVMLFDEPLSNLDVALRERTRAELRTLQKGLGTTSIYVTHDQQEALAVSDVLGVMRDGRLVQVGSPQELYNLPDTSYVARFLGGSNVLEESAVTASFAAQAEARGTLSESGMARSGTARRLSVRPEDLVPSSEGPSISSVVSRQFLGPVTEWEVVVANSAIRLRLPSQTEIAPGHRLTASAARWVQGDQ